MPVTEHMRGTPDAVARCTPGDAVALTRELVRIDSRNPSLVPGAPGEEAAAALLAAVLERWGFAVAIEETSPGRPSVVARAGARGDRTLMLNGHLDVVGSDGMTHAPFDAEERDGRLYGRGAADMKGGVAAMCAAAWRAADAGTLRGGVVITAVADEEWSSSGTRGLLERGIRAECAVVTEPTRLAIAPAHRGFGWLEVTVHGRAAHGSRYDIGVDAIRLAAELLVELDRHEREVLTGRRHPLLGRASLHASTISGGGGMSTYPDRCVLAIERRTLPGETEHDILTEVEQACAAVTGRRPEFRADVKLGTVQAPSDVATDAPIVQALERALRSADEPVRIEGLSAWTDAALLNAAGIPAVCFGPGDIALAHSDEEWIAIDEIERATRVLERLLAQWTD